MHSISRPEFALQTRAFQGSVRTSCYLHSFATLRNWLRQPLQSLPLFKIKKLEIKPVISELELLSFHGITSEEENNIRLFLLNCKEIPLADEIKEKTIEIRKKYKTKLTDAIVAASAIVNNLPLITADKGFNQIEELNLKLIVPAM